jgi:phosphatidylserine/phosphatidylglycerophosphate/cardiolipin synthase-like enzyme
MLCRCDVQRIVICCPSSPPREPGSGSQTRTLAHARYPAAAPNPPPPPPPPPTASYVVPKGSLIRALTDAAARGVDVRVLMPGVSDVPVMPWVSARARFCLRCSACGSACTFSRALGCSCALFQLRCGAYPRCARLQRALRIGCSVLALEFSRAATARSPRPAIACDAFALRVRCRYQGRILHAKTMLVDDLALVGSHNLNYRWMAPLEPLPLPSNPCWHA